MEEAVEAVVEAEEGAVEEAQQQEAQQSQEEEEMQNSSKQNRLLSVETAKTSTDSSRISKDTCR